jgi:hypothetical protein
MTKLVRATRKRVFKDITGARHAYGCRFLKTGQ